MASCGGSSIVGEPLIDDARELLVSALVAHDADDANFAEAMRVPQASDDQSCLKFGERSQRFVVEF